MRALNGAGAANARSPRSVMQYIRVVVAKSYLVVGSCTGGVTSTPALAEMTGKAKHTGGSVCILAARSS